MHGKPIPQPIAGLYPEAFDDRLASMRTQIVHHRMNRIGLRVTRSNVQQIIGKLGRGAVVRHLGEMPPRLGLDTSEHIGLLHTNRQHTVLEATNFSPEEPMFTNTQDSTSCCNVLVCSLTEDSSTRFTSTAAASIWCPK